MRQDVPAFHKIAVRELQLADPIIKYGCVIGYATNKISTGSHVHVHNIRSGRAQQR